MQFLRGIVTSAVREVTAFPLATLASILLMIGLLGGIQIAHRFGILKFVGVVLISLLIVGLIAISVIERELSKHY